MQSFINRYKYGESSSLVLFIASFSIPEYLCYISTGLLFGKSGSKYTQQLCLIHSKAKRVNILRSIRSKIKLRKICLSTFHENTCPVLTLISLISITYLNLKRLMPLKVGQPKRLQNTQTNRCTMNQEDLFNHVYYTIHFLLWLVATGGTGLTEPGTSLMVLRCLMPQRYSAKTMQIKG